jgi:serine protein kinase
MPSRLRQIGIAKTEPGDENNQDISSLVGKVDIRKLETFSQNDPDAYSYFRRPEPRQPGPARIRRDVQGADQDAAPAADRDAGRQLHRHREYRRHPVPGIILAHSNEAEWQSFKQQQEQRGLHRPHLRRQGAVLPAGDRRAEDLREADPRLSELAEAPCAPATLEMLARFACCRA